MGRVFVAVRFLYVRGLPASHTRAVPPCRDHSPAPASARQSPGEMEPHVPRVLRWACAGRPSLAWASVPGAVSGRAGRWPLA